MKERMTGPFSEIVCMRDKELDFRRGFKDPCRVAVNIYKVPSRVQLLTQAFTLKKNHLILFSQ